MDYDRVYSDAVSQEEKAINLISLILLIMACLFFFAAILLKEPHFGFEIKTLKDTIMIGAVLLMVAGFIPKMYLKKKNNKLNY